MVAHVRPVHCSLTDGREKQGVGDGASRPAGYSAFAASYSGAFSYCSRSS